jgi:methanethiol S-methyltransferase
MAIRFTHLPRRNPNPGLLFAWSGVAIMWAFWICFIIFLASPKGLFAAWPLPTVDRGGSAHSLAAALIDLGLIALFGLQHSLMARPWFKEQVMAPLPAVFQRCTYVHMANLVLFALILLWQPIPIDLWNVQTRLLQNLIWLSFAAGWVILFLGAWSFGMRDLLGLEQMRAWVANEAPPQPRLKTGWLYRWLRHPMYVGVLLGVWATPRMTVGHALLALGLTGYVLIALRYEERDLRSQFGARYSRWREATN